MSSPDSGRSDAGRLALDGHPRCIYILGGEASGKTTLAHDFGHRLGVPVHQLDSIAWRGATGPDRPSFDPRFQPTDDLVLRAPSQRLALVAEIAAADAWIAEGKHIGWTEELVKAADLVVWLDHVPFRVAALRILRRAARSSKRTTATRLNRGRLIRAGDYVRRSRQLFEQLSDLRTYYRSEAGDATDAYDATAVTRAATMVFLRPYQHKLRHVRSEADLRQLIDEL